jgi:hypothetical protein
MRLLTASEVSMLVPGSWEPDTTATDHVFRNDPQISNPPAIAPAAIVNLSLQQLQALTPAQLAAMTPAQLAAFSPAMLQAMSAAQLAAYQLALSGQGSGSASSGGAGAVPGVVPSNLNPFPWSAFTSRIPVPLSLNPNVAVLNASVLRNYMLIQNNSTAISPDTAPNLLVNLDGPVDTSQQQQYVNVPPTFGLVFDTRVPSNPIFLAWGSFADAGGSAIVGAVVWSGYMQNG